jgi:hypothetical protein
VEKCGKALKIKEKPCGEKCGKVRHLSTEKTGKQDIHNAAEGKMRKKWKSREKTHLLVMLAVMS